MKGNEQRKEMNKLEILNNELIKANSDLIANTKKVIRAFTADIERMRPIYEAALEWGRTGNRDALDKAIDEAMAKEPL